MSAVRPRRRSASEDRFERPPLSRSFCIPSERPVPLKHVGSVRRRSISTDRPRVSQPNPGERINPSNRRPACGPLTRRSSAGDTTIERRGVSSGREPVTEVFGGMQALKKTETGWCQPRQPESTLGRVSWPLLMPRAGDIVRAGEPYASTVPPDARFPVWRRSPRLSYRASTPVCHRGRSRATPTPRRCVPSGSLSP